MRSAKLFIAILVGAGVLVGAQSAEVLFDTYLQAVRLYQHNTFDSRSSPVAEFTKSELSKIRPLLQKQAPEVIQTAALVHTEIALTATDGERVDLHLAFAEAVLKLLPTDFAPGPAFSTGWHHVVPTIYLARRDPESARPFIERGLRAFPDDARLHLLSGIAHETTAQLHAINCVDQGCLTRQLRLDLLKRTGFAASEYRRALQLNGRLVDAQLRLGRVMTLSDDPRAARSAIEAALANGADVSQRYLAALFLASIATEAGDLQRARTEYESATTLCPSCQTAYIGLGFVEAMIGGRTDSGGIERLFSREPLVDSDPWVAYQFPSLDSMTLDALRAEVRQ